jgi:hypothetical protein
MRAGGLVNDWKILPLAQDGTLVFETSFTDRVFTGNPSVLALPAGRLIVAADQTGPGVRGLPGAKGKLEHFNRWLQGRIYVSGDHGKTWSLRADFPFCNPCLFRDGNTVYLLGHDDNVQILKSLDGGETWSKPVALTREGGYGDLHTHSPASVLAAHGALHAAFLRISDFSARGSLASRAAPVFFRAPQNSVLTSPKAWAISAPGPTLSEFLSPATPTGVGIPFFPLGPNGAGEPVGRGRWANPPGWSALHLVQVHDPDHAWFTGEAQRLHLLAQSDLHRPNWAILGAVAPDAAGHLRLQQEKTAAGKPWLCLPLPGGHAKFDLFYDEPSSLYWLVSNLCVGSLTRPDRLPETQAGLPCDEMHRVQLHFSRNLADWCFAGLVCAGAGPADARRSCAVSVRGGDLSVVCASGGPASRNSADTTRITHHLVPDFRSLAYA